MADGSMLDLTQVLNLANCAKLAGCTSADMNAVTDDRPWGANNPRWQPYLYGSLASITGNPGWTPSLYVVVWVGDDPSEEDGNPLLDDPREAHAGHGMVVLHAEAFGAASRRRVTEATVARAPHGLRVHSWKELR
jgi:hypothetical protein